MKEIQMLQFTIGELETIIRESVKKELDIYFNNSELSLIKNTDIEYLSPKETQVLLGISKSSYYNWKKEGRIIEYGIGGKRFVKKNEVEHFLIKTNKPTI